MLSPSCYDLMEDASAKFFSQECFLIIFYFSGYCDHHDHADWMVYRQKQCYKNWRILGYYILCIGLILLLPGKVDFGPSLYIYPHYVLWHRKVSYVMGTWFWLIVWERDRALIYWQIGLIVFQFSVLHWATKVPTSFLWVGYVAPIVCKLVIICNWPWLREKNLLWIR